LPRSRCEDGARDRRPPSFVAQERQSEQIPDAILAATASVHDVVLVTRNIRHFQNVPGLVVENWFSEE
jgi:predicted nucleic acid-binding protein